MSETLPKLIDAIAVPPTFGAIRRKDIPAATWRGLVVCIEDLHANPGVQRNISAIVDVLLTKYSFRHIYTEGTWGPIDSSVMRLFPDAEIKEKACDYLLNKGMLTGQERAVCMRPELDITFSGVDDEKLFTEHKSIGAQVAKVKDRALDLTRSLVENLFSRCKPVLAQDLWEFMKLCRDRDKGTIAHREYLSQLHWYASLNGVSIVPSLLDQMVQTGIVPRSGSEARRPDRLASREEEITEADFRQDIAVKLCLTDVDRRFLRVVTSCDLIGDAFQAKLTAQRARKFLGLAVEDVRAATQDDLTHINDLLQTCGVPGAFDLRDVVMELAFLWDWWKLPAGYYRAAKTRSHFMAQETNRQMSAQGVEKAMIVVGGFHAFHCCRDLYKRYSIACVTITPVVESPEAPDYWKRISGDLVTVEEILADAQKVQSGGGTKEGSLGG